MVGKAPLSFDAQPKGLGIGQLTVVDAAQVELGLWIIAPFVQQLGKVVPSDRVARLQLEGPGESCLCLD